MAIKSGSVEGLEELIRATQTIAGQAMPGLNIASRNAAGIVLASAKAKVHKLTGTLEMTLVVRKMATQKKPLRSGYKVTLGKGGAYGIPLELGHAIRCVINGKKLGQVSAKPFLRPAADESKASVQDMLIEAMNKELDKWGDKP